MGPRRPIISQICYKIGPVGPMVLVFVTKVVLCGTYSTFVLLKLKATQAVKLNALWVDLGKTPSF